MKRQYQVMALTGGTVMVLSIFAVPVIAQGMRNSGVVNNRGYGARSMSASSQASQSTTATSSSLSSSESQTLQYMLEEEKLAHDVYVKMYDTWGVSIFNNISKSESKHQSSVASAATYYGVSDTRTSSVGTFTNSDLQKLYDSLIAKGLVSQNDAYEVGKIIEEQDIADLQKAISESSSSYLDTIYTNLLKGSQNHLKAFSSRISS